MPNIKVPEQLYEKIKKMADEQGKAMWEVIQAAFDKMEVGDIQINLPKPKFIRLQYPAWCVIGNHKVDPERYKEQSGRDLYALWFPGLNGVVCIDCLIKHVFTQEQQAKTLARLEVEIRKLRAIKRQLNKEVEELAVRYSFAEILAGLRDAIATIEDKTKALDDLAEELAFCRGEEVCDAKLRELQATRETLEQIKAKLEKLDMPDSWARKMLEQLGVSRGSDRWAGRRSGYWR